MLNRVFSLRKVAAVFAFIIAAVSRSFASEANLIIPDLASIGFFGNAIDGKMLLMSGFLICIFGLFFGLYHFVGIKNLPVHKSMKSISELIYETCKTYLVTQGKFIFILEVLLAAVIVVYFGLLQHFGVVKVVTIVLCSVIGILGSCTVAWFGMRINTFANSRTAFASLKGNPFPLYAIPLRAGMSIGMLLISIELFIMLIILLFIPSDFAGACFIGFAIGESLGASVLRIAGGIFTKIADIGSDLMKIVFNIKEDDARNPGVIADCTGDNAGDSVGPTADGFETYGVTGVALVTFIVLAVKEPVLQVKLLVWIFVMRLIMLISSALSYGISSAIAKARYATADKMNFETPLTFLVWITSIVSITLTFAVSNIIIGDLGDGTLWWKLSLIISCGTIAGAMIPEIVKIFTSVKSAFVQNVVTSSKHGGASLNVLAGLTAGNFSAYWLGIAVIVLMGIAYAISLYGLDLIMIAPAVFAFGLVAFGFLGMGPVTIAVDSYGPVTDNAQSVYELSLIESIPNIGKEIEKDFGFKPSFSKSKILLEENDGAGNTFKATAKPVLIGTAVVGATTMIFSTIVMLTDSLTTGLDKLSLLHAPFLLGLIAGGAVTYWFTGSSNHAVTSGAYKAVEFIKNNIKLDGSSDRASTEDSKKVVEICTKYAQKGMVNLFLVIFFTTLAFAFIEPYFFIGYLISIALFGLFQAIFMANAGGAWDNAKKYVEVDLREKGTELHKATVVGDTVGDPFKDTSSVAMNPIIKFTTLFGLLALELALVLAKKECLNAVLAVVFFCTAIIFVVRSFTDMRAKDEGK
ncbi:sodium-translocating pyrophosphatase [Candidatus Endomicrobiellum trichonymphae]|uniref:K(+)-insensitive pyrophosphate-energized proton pump n=1 Tax=Endomicrobium trichonymphae TaxID=1408204 RepID=B1GYU4_ENDTX|nr:sodium-translocating pyrophosphatase [Candidatus Endomicrobium trichonymphae]BAG14187.1 pyrophosphate-energized H+/Na+ pump [Candidatus Endomicrobium trichonymphae]